MSRNLILAGAIALVSLAPAAQAAQLKFSLSGLSDSFLNFGTSVAGGFGFDTASSGFSDISVMTPIGSYGDGSGTLIPNTTGFGFPQDIFSFDNGATKFFFSIAGLDLAAPPSGSLTYDGVFAFESDMVGEDFTIGFSDKSTFYVGAVSVVAVAPVPLPATLPLMLIGLGGLGIALRHRKAV